LEIQLAATGMRIGELARSLGTSTKTLRFYEQIGLLQAPQRSRSAYRLYDPEAIRIARLVVELRRLDLSLSELQEVVRDQPAMGRRRRLLALMDEKLRSVYLQLSVLQGRCDDLAARHQALLATPRDRPPDCVCEALLRPCDCGAAELPATAGRAGA
jgi:DNA-binding transcriptional MerR regulator